MDDQLHIIIAGDKGKVFKLPCSKKKLCAIAAVSAVSFFILTITSICSFSLYTQNCSISNQLTTLQTKLQKSEALIAKHDKLTEKLRVNLDQKVARLKENNIKLATAFQQEKDTLISSAVEELNERSELIGKIINSIGIKLPDTQDSDSKHSGGLFIEEQDTSKDVLLFKADKYLKTIRYLPIGKPVTGGTVSSKFGKRKDPLNHRSAFHTGVDIRAKKGDPIHATADGVVLKAFRNGGYGNYVVIDHGNGYTSSFAHMQKYMVHKGDKVKRGQLIGLVGSTGRSTGSHLHYEIALKDKPINPANFMKIANLTPSSTSLPEKN